MRIYFNPRSREGSDSASTLTLYDLNEISIHAPAKGATNIELAQIAAYQDFNPRSREGSDSNFDQKFIPLFDKKSQIIFFEIKFPLSYPLFFPKHSSFVHISGCEFLYDFMSASHSHSHIITKLTYHLLQFHDQHPCAPPLPDTYFLNSRISNCQHSHQ